MATTKAYRTKVSTQRSEHLMPKPANFQPSKVIVLKVNPSLDKGAEEPLNHKAAEARSMFANHRKNH